MGLALAGAMTTTAVLMNNITANADTVVDDHTIQVEAGDTLSELAHKHDTSVDQLVKDNHIANANLIHVGDKLVVTPGVKNTANNGDTTKNSVQNSQVTTNNNTNSTNTTNATATASSSVSGSSAGEAIAQDESGGDYNARNGRYIGKYQLDAAYLNGDYSPANQERVFQQYCQQRYGSVNGALQFRQSHGWY